MVLNTPGKLFLIRVLLSLVSFCVILTGGRFGLNHWFGLVIPTWVVAVMPLVMVLRIGVREIKKHRRAAALGAICAPKAIGRWPGNVDVLIQMIKDSRDGYPSDGPCRWMQSLGSTINMYVLWEDVILTVNPEHLKIILATDFPTYVKGEKFRVLGASVLGTGVFISDGDMWKFHRSMTRPFFTRDRVTHFDIFELHVEDAIKQMKMRFKTGHAVDFQDLISRFTLDSASEFLFGHNVSSLSAALPYAHNAAVEDTQHSTAEAFAVALAQAECAFSQRLRIGWAWPLWEIFEDKTAEPMKIVNSFLDPIVEDAVEKHRSLSMVKECTTSDEVGDDETLLDHLVKFTTNRTILKDEVLNILIAGKDTTAATMTFLIYALSTNPAVFARLREEVLSKVGASARPTYDDIRDMKYLRAVINETLRLFPAVPFNSRENVHDTTLPGENPGDKPIYIPANTTIVYSIFLMHRRTDLWGPDALEFDPDRFLDERARRYLTPNPFIFLPFNAGPRICLGQQFAYNQMSYVLIRLLQNFSSMSLDTDSQPPETRPPASWATAEGRKATEKFWPKIHLTMYANGGLWVKMREAEYA